VSLCDRRSGVWEGALTGDVGDAEEAVHPALGDGQGPLDTEAVQGRLSSLLSAVCNEVFNPLGIDGADDSIEEATLPVLRVVDPVLGHVHCEVRQLHGLRPDLREGELRPCGYHEVADVLALEDQLLVIEDGNEEALLAGLPPGQVELL